MEVIEERWRPNLGEDIRTSSRSRRMTVVFLAFLSPSNRDLSVSTSTSNYKQSRDQCENRVYMCKFLYRSIQKIPIINYIIQDITVTIGPSHIDKTIPEHLL